MVKLSKEALNTGALFESDAINLGLTTDDYIVQPTTQSTDQSTEQSTFQNTFPEDFNNSLEYFYNNNIVVVLKGTGAAKLANIIEMDIIQKENIPLSTVAGVVSGNPSTTNQQGMFELGTLSRALGESLDLNGDSLFSTDQNMNIIGYDGILNIFKPQMN